MDDQAIYGELTQIFRELLHSPALVITPASAPDDMPGWDSGAMVAIVMAVEEQFGVEFAPRDLRGIRKVDDLAQLIRRHKG